MPYRATRTEPRVGVGSFTADLEKGAVYEVGEGHYGISQDAADALVEAGLLFEVPDGSTDNAWYDSDDPVLASQGDPEDAEPEEE